MITTTIVSIAFAGDTFSPEAAEQVTGLRFTEKEEPGFVSTKAGRYQGRPQPDGWACIHPPAEIPDEAKIDWLLDLVIPHMQVLRSSGVTHGQLYVAYGYEHQCNLTFRAETIQRLAQTGLDLWVSCWDDTEDEEEGLVRASD